MTPQGTCYIVALADHGHFRRAAASCLVIVLPRHFVAAACQRLVDVLSLALRRLPEQVGSSRDHFTDSTVKKLTRSFEYSLPVTVTSFSMFLTMF